MASKLNVTFVVLMVISLLVCAWIKPLDTIAMKSVDEGFERAAISFGTARLIGAAISLVEDIDLSFQPFGIGMEISPGQVLHSIGDLADKFADLMLAATVIFGMMKILLVIGGSQFTSTALTVTALGWLCYPLRRNHAPILISKLFIFLLLVRFAVPVSMLGSDAVFRLYLANDYKSSQTALALPTQKLEENDKLLLESLNSKVDSGLWNTLKEKIRSNRDMAKSMIQKTKEVTENIIKIIVVFLLQTLVFPLLFFWGLYRVLTAMFHESTFSRTNIAIGDLPSIKSR